MPESFIVSSGPGEGVELDRHPAGLHRADRNRRAQLQTAAKLEARMGDTLAGLGGSAGGSASTDQSRQPKPATLYLSSGRRLHPSTSDDPATSW